MSISLVALQNPKAVSMNLSISVSIRSNLSVIMETTKQRSVTEQIRNESIINLGLSTITFKWFGFMVLNATFNNISVRSWRSVLLVEETGENHRPGASH